MSWLTENPWPLVILCGVVAAILLLVWASRRRLAILLAAGLSVLLGGAVYIVERSIITDSERIEQHVLELTDAFRRKEIPVAVEFFSQQAPDLRRLVQVAANLVTIREPLRVTDLHVRMLSQNSRAISHFRANGTISVGTENVGHQASRWELTWQREADDWKVIEVERLNPINGSPMPLQIPGS